MDMKININDKTINTNDPYIYLFFWVASLINTLVLFFYIYPASISHYTGFHPVVAWILLIILTAKATMVDNKEYSLMPDSIRNIFMTGMTIIGFYWLVMVKDNMFLAIIVATIIVAGKFLKPSKH